jgi:AcrR family transcriptional regulator
MKVKRTTVAPELAPDVAYHHGDLRNALLSAAITALGETGSSEFSLSELARNVGVTPAAAYKHFANKDALVHALARHGFDLLRERFEAAAPSKKTATAASDALRRFERLGFAYLCFGLEEPALFSLIFGKGATEFRRANAPGPAHTPTFAYLADALTALHQFKQLSRAPTDEDRWFAWSAIHGATQLAVSGVTTRIEPERAAKLITNNVMKALRG